MRFVQSRTEESTV